MRRAPSLFHRLASARARPRPWAWALGASVLAHGLLLLPHPTRHSAGPSRTVALALAVQTRALALPRPVPAPAELSREPADAPAPAPAQAQAQAQAVTKAPAAPAAQAPSSAPPASAEPVSGDPAPPTAIAPAAEWLYLLRQNGREGVARLSWQPQNGGYQLRLERELAGRPLPGWRSQGRLDEQGLAPQRYAQQRRGRDAQATNFRREEGMINFSASTEQVALPAGVQDRISWWLQLAAIVTGAPQRFGPGSEIRLPVAGLRGEVREWVFEVVGEEPLVLPGGVLASSLHLRRSALGAYDGSIEVWLDPARGHLPVKLSLSLPDERGWELQLADDKVKP